ncbi:MAG TPA: methyltransferase domain-containing protein [Jiangellaceae bacterium]|nr:methyltransferase domain-containing protein [Jiangellaceae bacterium]
MAERLRRDVRTAVAWDVLTRALAGRAKEIGHDRLDIVDAGGGTGGFAVPLAAQGHRVTVVDPSPDALAALERRAAEAGLTGRVDAVQGDAADLADLLGPDSADAVLCHGVLEVVDEPAEALRGVRAVLRRGGLASTLIAQRYAAVLARAVAGHLADALHLLSDPAGRWGNGDPLPRRFDEPSVRDLFEAAGMRVLEVHGVRVFADLVPGFLADDPASSRQLLDLEATAAGHPAFRAVAGQLHVLATPAPGQRPMD